MTESQNRIIATLVAALILVPVFLCPWRVTSTDELTWSPIYQTPISYVRSYDEAQSTTGQSRMEYEPATIAWDLLVLEVVAVAVLGGLLYVRASRRDEDPEAPLRPPNG